MTWPADVDCGLPALGTVKAVTVLDEIQGWASTDRTGNQAYAAAAAVAHDLAEACGAHTGESSIHAARTMIAWAYAKLAIGIASDPGRRLTLWLACASELNHGNDGSGFM